MKKNIKSKLAIKKVFNIQTLIYLVAMLFFYTGTSILLKSLTDHRKTLSDYLSHKTKFYSLDSHLLNVKSQLRDLTNLNEVRIVSSESAYTFNELKKFNDEITLILTSYCLPQFKKDLANLNKAVTELDDLSRRLYYITNSRVQFHGKLIPEEIEEFNWKRQIAYNKLDEATNSLNIIIKNISNDIEVMDVEIRSRVTQLHLVIFILLLALGIIAYVFARFLTNKLDMFFHEHQTEFDKQHRSLKNYLRVLELSPFAFITATSDNKIVDLNANALKLLNAKNKNQIKKRKASDFIRWNDKEDNTNEATLLGLNGSKTPIIVKKQEMMLFDRSHNIYSITDISQQKENESKISAFKDQLQTSLKSKTQNLVSIKQRLKKLFEHSNDALVVLDLDSNFIDCNDKAVNLFGYSKIDLMKMNSLSLISNYYLPKAKEIMINILETKLETTKMDLKKADGTSFIAEITGTLSENEAGKTILVIIKDITKQIHKENVLRKDNHVLNTLFEKIPFGIIITSIERKIIDMNIMMENLLKLKRHSIKEEDLSIILPVADEIDLNEEVNFINNVKLKYDNEKKYRVVASEIEKEFIIWSFTEEIIVTQEINLDSQNVKNRDDEIRAEINSIVEYSEVLESLVEDQNQRYLSLIKESGKALLNIIEDKDTAQEFIPEEKNENIYEEIEQNQIDNIIFNKANVLMIEENELITETFKINLEKMGLYASAVKSVGEAFTELNFKKPDIIFVNLKILEINKFDFIKRIRMNDFFSSIPVVAISSSISNIQKEKILRSGANEYIAKPFNKGKLQKILSKYISNRIAVKSDKKITTSVEFETCLVTNDIDEIDKKFAKKWLSLTSNLAADEVHKFANSLKTEGKKKNVQKIYEYGEKLQIHAKNLDLESLTTTFKQYPELIEELRNN